MTTFNKFRNLYWLGIGAICVGTIVEYHTILYVCYWVGGAAITHFALDWFYSSVS